MHVTWPLPRGHRRFWCPWNSVPTCKQIGGECNVHLVHIYPRTGPRGGYPQTVPVGDWTSTAHVLHLPPPPRRAHLCNILQTRNHPSRICGNSAWRCRLASVGSFAGGLLPSPAHLQAGALTKWPLSNSCRTTEVTQELHSTPAFHQHHHRHHLLLPSSSSASSCYSSCGRWAAGESRMQHSET